MTVCTYISPFKNPAISTDIVVTHDSFPSAKRPGEPISIKNEHDRIIYHARKNYIMSDKTCVAVAGDSYNIEKFLRECQDNIHIYELSDRPARLIGDLAEKYGNIEIISSTVCKNFSETHCAPRESNIDMPDDILGLVRIIGSGSEKVKKFIYEYLQFAIKMREMHLRAEVRPDAGNSLNSENLNFTRDRWSSIEIIRGLFSAISSRFLYLDMEKITNSASYGAFTEYSYFDPFLNIWRRQPSQIFFYYLIENSGTKFHIRILNRFFAYDPGVDHGVLFSCGEHRRDIHVLQNIISLEDFDLTQCLNTYLPKTATVSFLAKKPNGHIALVGTISTEEDESEEIIFEKSPSSFGMSPSWLEKTISKFGDAVWKHLS